MSEKIKWKITSAEVKNDGAKMTVKFYANEHENFSITLPAGGWVQMLNASAAIHCLVRAGHLVAKEWEVVKKLADPASETQEENDE